MMMMMMVLLLVVLVLYLNSNCGEHTSYSRQHVSLILLNTTNKYPASLHYSFLYILHCYLNNFLLYSPTFSPYEL